MNKILYDIKLFIFRKNMVLGLISIIIISIINIFFIKSENPIFNPNIPPMTSFEYFINVQGGASGTLFLILPLVITLTSGDIFIKEKLSSIMSYSILRSNSTSYIKNKLLSIGITSFLFILICQISIFIITLILFPVDNPDLQQAMIVFAKDLLISKPLLYCFIIILNSCLMAFWFSSFSVLVSIFVNNFYSAMMLPYILLIGVSQLLMGLPMMFGVKAIPIYNMSPLVLAGDYITIDFNLFTPTFYSLFMCIITFYSSIYFFKKRLIKEGLSSK